MLPIWHKHLIFFAFSKGLDDNPQPASAAATTKPANSPIVEARTSAELIFDDSSIDPRSHLQACDIAVGFPYFGNRLCAGGGT
jgi:hypothetical protein